MARHGRRGSLQSVNCIKREGVRVSTRTLRHFANRVRNAINIPLVAVRDTNGPSEVTSIETEPYRTLQTKVYRNTFT